MYGKNNSQDFTNMNYSWCHLSLKKKFIDTNRTFYKTLNDVVNATGAFGEMKEIKNKNKSITKLFTIALKRDENLSITIIDNL